MRSISFYNCVCAKLLNFSFNFKKSNTKLGNDIRGNIQPSSKQNESTLNASETIQSHNNYTLPTIASLDSLYIFPQLDPITLVKIYTLYMYHVLRFCQRINYRDVWWHNKVLCDKMVQSIYKF